MWCPMGANDRRAGCGLLATAVLAGLGGTSAGRLGYGVLADRAADRLGRPAGRGGWDAGDYYRVGLHRGDGGAVHGRGGGVPGGAFDSAGTWLEDR